MTSGLHPMPWQVSKGDSCRDPCQFFVRDTRRGLLYLARDLLLATVAWSLAAYIDPFFKQSSTRAALSPIGAEVSRWAAWGVYWWFQGLIFTGIWVIGHECGHGAFSDHKWVNDIIGFITHSFLWTPYFSWKISHHRHHSNHASMERDEVYVPKTRSDLGIPAHHEGLDYEEILGDTPIYTLYMLIRQQVLAFPAYLLFNVSGQKTYPKWTNHFDPNSILFTKAQRNAVIMSNLGIAAMVWGVSYSSSIWGASEVTKFYGIPWLCVSHWFIMITYLHHTDPVMPHYRGKEWNFQRFFPKMPFYHGPEATQHLKAFIGDHYVTSDVPAFKALWSNYNKCQFVEDEGDVLFYRDRKGQAIRRPADEYRVKSKAQ
ncbi:fatty acid desaturase-domain-containing protein [Infundibulicybe gibba]|nr:fatty acid desaturase-domain-containing protein [Infundibulicybe gibba]